MLFDCVLGLQEVDNESANINHREAVRAIILHYDSILMAHSNKGDYKFPGGGVNGEESHGEALRRELREERGSQRGKQYCKSLGIQGDCCLRRLESLKDT